MRHAAVIDVGEWQTVVNLRDGREMAVEHPRVELARGVLASHSYPGDLSDAGLRWVTDTALDLCARYDPGYIMLNYVYAYMQAVYRGATPEGHAAAIQAVAREVGRFLEATGYEPVIVGLGGIMPCRGQIETLDLDATVATAGMHTGFVGLYDATLSDVDRLLTRPGVERIIDRATFRETFGGSDAFYEAFPDLLAVAEDGYRFRGVNVGTRVVHHMPRREEELPVYTTLPGAEALRSLTDVAGLVLKGLETRRVALVLVEGVSCSNFPWPLRRISNRYHWWRYPGGIDQYLALNTGEHFTAFDSPPGFRLEVYDGPSRPYPFSGTFRTLPQTSIGLRYPGRSAAVGARSMITHVVAGAEIAVECFARSLYNQGVMAAVRLEGDDPPPEVDRAYRPRPAPRGNPLLN